MTDPQPVPPPQPVQKSKAGPIIAIIAAIVLVLCVGCVGGAWYFGFWFQKKADEIVNSIPTDFPTKDAAAPQNNNQSHKVRYEVNGSGKAKVLYAKGTGGQQTEDVDLPWSAETTVNAKNFGLQVVAYKDDKDTSFDNCKIFVDGVEKKAASQTIGTSLTCSYVFLG